MGKSVDESRVGPESRGRLCIDYIMVTMESHDKKVGSKSWPSFIYHFLLSHYLVPAFTYGTGFYLLAEGLILQFVIEKTYYICGFPTVCSILPKFDG